MRARAPCCLAPRRAMLAAAKPATVVYWLCAVASAAALECGTALAAVVLLVLVASPFTALTVVSGGGARCKGAAPYTRSAAGVLCGALLLAQVAAEQQLKTSPGALQRNNVILQYGQPRTASTFQTKLLELVGRVRAQKSGRKFAAFYSPHERLSKVLSRECDDTMFCLVKTHDLKISAAEKRELFDTGRVFLFTSRRNRVFADNIGPLVKHEQLYDTFLKESLYNCVAHYQPIFDLTDDEVLYIQEFLKIWQITRKCCGFQSSRDWMNELHNISAPKKHPDYALDAADCGLYDLPAVERRIQTTMFAVGFKVDGGGVVSQPTEHLDGTFCTRTNKAIADGADFNARVLPRAQRRSGKKRVTVSRADLHTWR